MMSFFCEGSSGDTSIDGHFLASTASFACEMLINMLIHLGIELLLYHVLLQKY